MVIDKGSKHRAYACVVVSFLFVLVFDFGDSIIGGAIDGLVFGLLHGFGLRASLDAEHRLTPLSWKLFLVTASVGTALALAIIRTSGLSALLVLKWNDAAFGLTSGAMICLLLLKRNGSNATDD